MPERQINKKLIAFFTTYQNLSMWFDSWENFIVEEGFG
jgi:hypothetical protein